MVNCIDFKQNYNYHICFQLDFVDIRDFMARINIRHRYWHSSNKSST